MEWDDEPNTIVFTAMSGNDGISAHRIFEGYWRHFLWNLFFLVFAFVVVVVVVVVVVLYLFFFFEHPFKAEEIGSFNSD